MNILSVESISKSYSEKILFDNLSFGISEGDRIGLIGINGSGKSTLLKVVAMIEPPDSGQVTMANSASIAFLSQNPDLDLEGTVIEAVFCGSSPKMQLLRAYHQAADGLANSPQDAALQDAVVKLSARMDALHAWDLEYEAKTMLSKLGIVDLEASVHTLSGGQRKRVALAQTLVREANLLVLDEPTNQMDSESVEWLEQYLALRAGAVLLVTHDRYFLDRVANRMLELDKGVLRQYVGNYEKFLESKTARELQDQASEDKRQNFLRNELEWIKRGPKARGTKQKARIARFEQVEAARPEESSKALEIVTTSARLGRKVAELANVRKCFGDRTIIEDFSAIFLPGSRVGIVGSNGTGKTTLLNLIAGKILPDTGSIDIGQTVRIGYFTQEHTTGISNLRVLEYIKEDAAFIETIEGERLSAGQMLELFQFPRTMHWTPIRKLSGGERRRLDLLKVLIDAPNLLLLDEPTNDLDLVTLSVLEQYLDKFAGTVIVVSHDRYFLDRVVDEVFAFTGDGSIQHYLGNYSDYREKVSLTREHQVVSGAQREKTPLASPSKDPEPAGKAEPAAKARHALKFSYREQKEYEEIEGRIEDLEQELKRLDASMESAGADYVLLQELSGKQQEAKAKLDLLMERWAYLSELAEAIEANRQR